MMSNVNPLYTAAFDLNKSSFNPYMHKIEASVCFHFIPRSGSNFLSDLLFQTKTLGVPLEYFSRSNYNDLMGRLVNFDRLLQARSSKQGVFSFKWNSDFENVPNAVSKYKTLQPKYHIFLDRKNREKQAVSFAQALKSQQWVRTHEGDAQNLPVNEFEIEVARKKLDKIRKKTVNKLENGMSSYLKIMFEDLIEDPKMCLERIYTHCEVRCPSILPDGAIALLPSSRNKEN